MNIKSKNVLQRFYYHSKLNKKGIKCVSDVSCVQSSYEIVRYLVLLGFIELGISV